MQRLRLIRTATAAALLVVAAQVGAVPGDEPAPADDRLGAAISRVERALERGVHAAGQGVRAGAAAAARGVERAAAATARAAEGVARKLEQRRAAPEAAPERGRRGPGTPPRGPTET
ncbi:MAG: hypothetical protein JNL85_03655 [Rubrivivax sp.]|nr:hypothetical protein [Rubrivivax sp.]